MNKVPGENISFSSDIEAATEVIRHAGAWMRDSNLSNYSDWWDPDQVSADMLRKYAEPDDFYVVEVDGHPAAAAILQSEQSMQDWSAVDKDNEPPKAIYMHYIAVEREHAGQGLVGDLVSKAAQLAKKRGASLLRLDTNADEPKLCSLYEGLGFVRVGTEQEEAHTTAFFEKNIIPTEIERKFVIEALPEGLDLNALPSKKIDQGYLANGPEGAVRVRRKGDKYFWTFKTASTQHSAERVELECEITQAQFDTMWPGTAGKRVEKTRYEIPFDGHVIELDIFEGENAGHMLAEVEFSSTSNADAFEPPEWFSRDVTADKAFGNANIAESGFPV